jgi:MSHA biogenesis protein MshQ
MSGILGLVLGNFAPAAGGEVTVIQSFTATGEWVCPTGVTEVEWLIVAGGGGGGNSQDFGATGAGGGGAGGFRTGTGLAVTAGTTYTVTVGAGGAGSTTHNVNGSDGISSVFNGTTSVGGGGGAGGGGAPNAGKAGNAGGLAAGVLLKQGQVGQHQPPVFSGQGNNGGDTVLRFWAQGGGGGAGAAGANASGTQSGNWRCWRLICYFWCKSRTLLRWWRRWRRRQSKLLRVLAAPVLG